jgi:hypothetical protein
MKTPTKKVVNKAKKDIVEIDGTLGLLRENWMVCSEKNKSKYMGLIDRMLDERLLCMATRDGKEITTDV